MPTFRERVLGCLLAGACGDALGAPTEFMRMPEIQQRYGPGGIRDLVKAYGVEGAITDDTQMTLFVVEGIIRAYVRAEMRGIGPFVPAIVHHALLRWLETQEGRYPPDPSVHDGILVCDRRLWARRAPGDTCLSALRANRHLGKFAENDSKGCGAVMRAAPFGFLAREPGDIARIMRMAADSGRTTHNHPSGYHSAAALAGIVGLAMLGRDLREAAAAVVAELSPDHEAREVTAALKVALALADAPDWRARLPELGGGWVGEEALAIALLCALAGENPEEALVAAANHDGDTDSTAAIAGNLLGAALGPTWLPERWLARLELRDVVETLARDFADLFEGQTDGETLWDRYPGW